MSHYTRKIFKLAENFEKFAGWFSKSADEKLISELNIQEFIELCSEAGLSNVKQYLGNDIIGDSDDYRVSFTYGSKPINFWLVVFKDASGGLFGILQDSKSWNLPQFRKTPPMTGADLIKYLQAVKNTINGLE